MTFKRTFLGWVLVLRGLLGLEVVVGLCWTLAACLIKTSRQDSHSDPNVIFESDFLSTGPTLRRHSVQSLGRTSLPKAVLTWWHICLKTAGGSFFDALVGEDMSEGGGVETVLGAEGQRGSDGAEMKGFPKLEKHDASVAPITFTIRPSPFSLAVIICK